VSGITQVDFRTPVQSGMGSSRAEIDVGTTDYSGKLEHVGSLGGVQQTPAPRPAKDGSSHHGRALRWAPSAVVGLGAAIGVVALGASLLAVVFVVVLACAATMFGWRIGENGRAALEQEIDDRSSALTRALSELEIAQAETVRRLSMAVEFRDEDTGAHIERIGRFSTLLAEQVGMEIDFCGRLSHAAPLHDVGKVAIPDHILRKPGKLTAAEFDVMRSHTQVGYELLADADAEIMRLAATIALTHHERWDGGGYPHGLSGDAISPEGRVVAIADVFDALTSDRVYRPAFPITIAIDMMTAERGSHFDPEPLDAMLAVFDQVEGVRRIYGD
jgi:HD-GYP domain-containing protein (c-di-GMP phosphodiesterase class II)